MSATGGTVTVLPINIELVRTPVAQTSIVAAPSSGSSYEYATMSDEVKETLARDLNKRLKKINRRDDDYVRGIDRPKWALSRRCMPANPFPYIVYHVQACGERRKVRIRLGQNENLPLWIIPYKDNIKRFNVAFVDLFLASDFKYVSVVNNKLLSISESAVVKHGLLPTVRFKHRSSTMWTDEYKIQIYVTRTHKHKGKSARYSKTWREFNGEFDDEVNRRLFRYNS